MIDEVWLRWSGPWGLARRQSRTKVDREVPVVADLPTVKRAAIRFFDRELYVGQKYEPFVGEGSEFEALREYSPGLDPRTIDWKASARVRELRCRQFRIEKNHQVVVALDAGHTMAEPVDGVPKIDRAITSALVLAYVALATGDKVGIHAFAARPLDHLEPRAGVGAFPALADRLGRLEYTTDETNYALGLLDLAKRLSRRSLIVLFTDFSDSVTAELIVENLQAITQRHLVLFVALRSPSTDELARGTTIRRPTDVGRRLLALDRLDDRHRVLERVARFGLRPIDATPESATPELIDRYISVRRRELIG